jgi:hypothetical protein
LAFSGSGKSWPKATIDTSTVGVALLQLSVQWPLLRNFSDQLNCG